MITTILLVILLTLLLIDFNRFFILYIITSAWISSLNSFWEGSDLYVILSIISFLIYLVKSKLKYRPGFPFIIPLVLLVLSFILSNFGSVYPHNGYLLGAIICNVLNIYIFWDIMKKNTQKYLPLFLKYTLIYGVIVGGMSLYETISSTNPYIELVNSLDLYTRTFTIEEVRFGIKRSQSIFQMHTTCGCISIILFCTLLYAKIKNYTFTKNTTAVNIVLILLILTVFFTGTRSAILSLMICLLSFVKLSIFNAKRLFFLFAFIIVASLILVDYLEAIYTSTFVNTEEVQGSSSDMRMIQFMISLNWLKKSPIIGNGLLYTWRIARSNANLAGAESIWFPIMIDQGILGLISYISFFISCIYYTLKSKMKQMIFFVLGIICFGTMSSIPNYYITHIAVTLIAMSRIGIMNEVKTKKLIQKTSSNVEK